MVYIPKFLKRTEFIWDTQKIGKFLKEILNFIKVTVKCLNYANLFLKIKYKNIKRLKRNFYKIWNRNDLLIWKKNIALNLVLWKYLTNMNIITFNSDWLKSNYFNSIRKLIKIFVV